MSTSATEKASATEAATIAEAFRITSARRSDAVAIRTKGDEFSITWGELRARVDTSPVRWRGSASARGDTLALMMVNRPEFNICDLATMMVGATPFSIYNTYTPEQIEYLMRDADAHFLICEQAFLPQVLKARESLPGLEHVIVIDGEAPEGTISLAEVEATEQRLRRRGVRRIDRPAGHPHADLHLRARRARRRACS